MQYKTDVRRFMRGEPGQLSSFATRLCGRYVLSLKELFVLYSFDFGSQFPNQVLGLPYTRQVERLKMVSLKERSTFTQLHFALELATSELELVTKLTTLR